MRHTPLTLMILFCFSVFFTEVMHAQDSISTPAVHEPERPHLAIYIENLSFFDNREVTSPYQRSQTLFGSRLGLEIGFEFGAHQIMLGASGTKDFGAKGLASTDYTFYYHYEKDHFSGAFGSFPRWRLKQDLPDVMIYDSLKYYTPSLNGALIQYENNYGYVELYCNWLYKQSSTQREIFEVVTDGRFGYQGYNAGWNIQLTHFSVPKPSNNHYVYDKLMVNPYLELDKKHLGFVDHLHINAGALVSFNRHRKDGIWKIPVGFLGDVSLRFKWFEIRDRLYAGQAQLNDYEQFGQMLHRGDPYYRSPLYNRTDISFYLLRRSYIECRAAVAFHVTEHKLDNSQMIYLRIFPEKNLIRKIFRK